MTRGLFGQDLTEYDIDIITESGLQAAEWEQIARNSRAFGQYHDRRSTQHFITKALRAAGVGAAGIAALSKLTFNWAKTKSSGEGKRLRSDVEDDDGDDEPLPFKRANLQEQSLLNLQEGVQADDMSAPTGSGNAKGLKETPIDPVRHVTRGPPEQAFCSLPYIRDVRVANTGWAYDIGFRMTSPLDPQITLATAVDQNAGAGTATTTTIEPLDSTDVTQTSARWFDFYSTLYNYYHVVGARWTCTVENLKTEPLWCHEMYINDEVPPSGATNEDIQCWNDAKSHFLGCHARPIDTTGTIMVNEANTGQNNVEGASTTGVTANYATGNHVSINRGKSPIIHLEGSYKPGQFRRQIHLDSEVENWTAVNANPALPERLLLRFKPYWNAIDTNNATSYDRLMYFRVVFKVDYLVEFKELKYGLRWPVERQPVIAAIQTNIEEDEE